MSQSTIAIERGLEYQALVFWKYATDMLRGDYSDIESIIYEDNQYKSLDDVVVVYKERQNHRGDYIVRDYIQVKYHNTQSGTITIDGLLEPNFIHAKNQSFMKRVYDVYKNNKDEFKKSRFILYTPWDINQNDPLYQLISNNDRSFELEKLFDGTKTDSSDMGKIRKKFRDSLGIENNDTLREVLAQVCIYSGTPSIAVFKDTLNTEFFNRNLKPWTESSDTYPYIDMLRRWYKEKDKDKKGFDAQFIMERCKNEGLVRQQEQKELLTIRSFSTYARDQVQPENPLLDLSSYFEGRRLKQGCNWEMIREKLNEFQGNNRANDTKYYVELATHFTVAFIAGRCMHSKAGAQYEPIQRTNHGGVCKWGAEDGDYREDMPRFVEPDKGSDNNLLNAGEKDVAIVISIRANIIADVKCYIKEQNLAIHRIQHLKLPETNPDSVKSGKHTWMLAEQIDAAINARKSEEKKGILHIFINGPVSLMFDLGKMSLIYGRIQLYEYDNGTYYPTAQFPLAGEPT